MTIEAKTGLSKALLCETFLPSLYRATAPYRGCGHGCRYCDGRAEKYFVEGDFERDIAVRENLPERVASDIARGLAFREYGAVCIGSGVTDIYQPLERDLALTRRTLEALVPAELPLVILTKNSLILRDFDLLARFPRVLVIVTVTAVDPEVSAILEPGASTPAERLAVVTKAKEAGFFSGVMAMPLCPGISDTEEQTTALFAAARIAGADFIYPGGLTLRPGRQKDLFLSVVGSHFPELLGRYADMYRENRPSGMPRGECAAPFMKTWNRELDGMHMPRMVDHRVYRELLAAPDSLFVLFCHMRSLFADKGVDTRPLAAATDRYAKWLSENRTALRRKKIPRVSSDPFPLTRILDEKLRDLCADPAKFAAVCGNARLSRLAAAVVNDGSHFDYTELALRS